MGIINRCADLIFVQVWRMKMDNQPLISEEEINLDSVADVAPIG